MFQSYTYHSHMTTETTKELRIALYSTPDSIQEIEPFLSQCRGGRQMSESLFSDILLVLTEAVNNSIIHGNNNNPSKRVTILFRSEGKNLHFKVCDEGKGFDPRKLPDPTHSSRIDQPHGRGVFIMQQLAHKVNYEDNGRTVLIQFREA